MMGRFDSTPDEQPDYTPPEDEPGDPSFDPYADADTDADADADELDPEAASTGDTAADTPTDALPSAPAAAETFALLGAAQDDQAARPHRGRARERVAKRRQARGTPLTPFSTSEVEAAAAPAPPPPDLPVSRFAAPASANLSAGRARTRRSSAQVTPSEGDGGRLALPTIRIPFLRLLLIAVGSLAFVAIVVFVLGAVRDRPAEEAANALWLGDEWTYSAPDEGQLAGLGERLRRYQVGTLFAWVTQLLPDRTWLGEPDFAVTASFVAGLRVADPTAQLYGWIRLDSTLIPLDDPLVREQVGVMARRVVDEMGFDGVLIQVDPVVNADENYLSLLRALRSAIGEANLAAAVPPDWTPVAADVPQPPLIAPGTLWDMTYKQRVALLVDALVVQSYNTGFSSPDDYRRWMAYQVGAFTSALALLDVELDLYIGIPTYDADPPRYNPAAENIAAAALGMQEGVGAASEAASFFKGAAIYAEWTTDAAEWESFRSEWLER